MKSLREKAYDNATRSDNPEWFTELVFNPKFSEERAYKLSKVQISHLLDSTTVSFIEDMCNQIENDNKLITLINILKHAEGVEVIENEIKALGFTMEELNTKPIEDILQEYLSSKIDLSFADLSIKDK